MNDQERVNDGLEKLKKESWYFAQNSLPQFKASLLDVNDHIKPELLMLQSLQQNGYVKLHTGLIIQWGLFSNAGSSSKNVFFPIAFSSFGSVIVTRREGTSTATLDVAKCCSVSNAKFHVVSSYIGTANATYSQGAFSWIAIGF